MARCRRRAGGNPRPGRRCGGPGRETNSPSNARTNVSHHYDLSHNLFTLFLDETMTYSSALIHAPSGKLPGVGGADLADARRRKIDRLLDRAGVGEGTRLLEIGTAWGEPTLRTGSRRGVGDP